jgi:hypothetical protein
VRTVVDSVQLRMLAAMDIDVYALRAHAPAATIVSRKAVSAPAAVPVTANMPPRLVVVCAQGVRGDVRLARLFAQLPQTLGVAAAAIGWAEADATDALAAQLSAPAYLVLGAAMARALGVQLSTMQQKSSAIAVTVEPAQLPGGAADKRALWQALKPLAQRLRGAAG